MQPVLGPFIEENEYIFVPSEIVVTLSQAIGGEVGADHAELGESVPLKPE